MEHQHACKINGGVRCLKIYLSQTTFNNQVSGRGPIVAELVAGDEVTCYDTKNNRSTNITTGKYLYIEPGSAFYFSAKENKEVNLVLFEIK